ncbi:MAG: hypothetical protein AAGA17_00085 [Actinomycetota bacterium]
MSVVETAQRACAPEWCEQGGPEHDDICDNALMPPMTKHRFVELQRMAAEQALESYTLSVEMDQCDMPDDWHRQGAVADVDEVATCYAGIGSCGRGWCNHS